MVFEEIDIFGHIGDFLFDFLEFGFEIFEVRFELNDLLVAVIFFAFQGALSFLKH